MKQFVETDLYPVLSRIDELFYKDKLISAEEAEDLSENIMWINGKQMNDANINFVVNKLRGYKKFMDRQAVSIVIKCFIETTGGMI